MKEKPEESNTSAAALTAMFDLSDHDARALLDEAGAPRFTSYFGPVSIIKRLLSYEHRVHARPAKGQKSSEG